MNKLIRMIVFAGTVVAISSSVHAQGFKNFLENTLDSAKKEYNGYNNNQNNNTSNNNNTRNNNSNYNNGGTSLSSLSNTDITSALREALKIGAQNAGSRLSAVNGYLGNALIKIVLPPEAQKVESTLRELGFGNLVDNAIVSMNRAAEDAAMKSVPIFINAITGMSIQDGISILTGGNAAATNYLRNRTTPQLTAAFKPSIRQSLDKVNATKYWKQLFTVYNELPTTFNKVNPDLPSYVTDRALNGLFITISDEENKIRANPAARVTGLLQKVFGAH